MAVLTSAEMTNLYLYGSKAKPADLQSDSIIRAENAVTKTAVNINDYMAGEGRFASPAFFEVLKARRPRKLSATPDLSGKVLPPCHMKNSA